MNATRLLFSALFLTAFFVGFEWIAWQSLHHLSFLFPEIVRISGRMLFLGITGLLVITVITMLVTAGRFGQRPWFAYLRATLMSLYLFKFLLILFSGIAFLLAWLDPGDSNTAVRIFSAVAIGFALVIAALLIGGMIRNPYRYRLFTHDLFLKDLPDELDGFRIVQISDIHSGSFSRIKPIWKGIELINRQSPDLVFFTGDLVNNRANEMDPLMDVFSSIKARYGVYSILGNHDYGHYVWWPDKEAKRTNFQRLLEVHQELGWTLLRNEHRVIHHKGKKVAVLGVENYSAKPQFPKYGRLDLAVEGLQEASVQLLLSHDPTHWDDEVIREYPKIDLTLSGHTHGFQFGIEIPGKFKWTPFSFIYRRWAGLYREGEQYLHVNRGFGFLGYPGRVGILPEVTLIVLRKV